MAEYLIQDTTLLAIADAIRSKSGKADTILVSDMATEILNLEAGGASELYLYNRGDTCSSNSGGWSTYGSCTVTYNTDHMYLRSSTQYATNLGIQAVNQIKLTDYSVLSFNGSTSGDGFYVEIVDVNGQVVASKQLVTNGTIDTSKLSGYYKIRLHCESAGSSGRNATVYTIVLLR